MSKKRILHFYHQPLNSRGVYVFHKNLMAARIPDIQIDSFQYKSTSDSGIPATFLFEDHSPDQIAEIANTYDVVILSNFPADHECMASYWEKITKPVKVFINHGDVFRRAPFDATLPFLQTSDAILTYSKGNRLSQEIRKVDPTLYDRIYPYRPPIDWGTYQGYAERSLLTSRDLPYVLESGAWEGRSSKNSLEMARLLRYANEIDVKFQDFIFLHIGISFSPAVHFGQMKVYPDTSVKCGKLIHNYVQDDFTFHHPLDKVNKVFLLRSYQHDWMFEIMSRSHFSYSFMTPILKDDGTRNPNIAGRFEYSQLEKCLYSLPIFDSNYLDLFQDMPKKVRSSFLSVDLSSTESYVTSIPVLHEKMKFLKENPKEYKKARMNILRYIQDKFTLETFANQLLTFDKRT